MRPESPSNLEPAPDSGGRASSVAAPSRAPKATSSGAGAADDRRPAAGLLRAITAPRLRVVLLLFFLWAVLRNAWVSDDAFITFRVADNFIHGLGLRWNPLERVQVFTHPLWLLTVSALYFVTRDIYFSAIALSLACSGLAVWLVLRELSSPGKLLIAGVVVSFSKAFVDYSTGGLENPLSHLLLVLFFLEYLKPDAARRFPRMMWFAGLALLNRLDLVWVLSPAVVHAAWMHGYWRARHWRLWVGLLPLVGWELFSLFYYGFLLPNSAYAKLFTGLGFFALLQQGGFYFVNSLAWDPITLFACVALLVVAFRNAKRDRPALMLGVGVALELLYTARIGGDFMSGRFFAGPLIVALLLLTRFEFDDAWESLGVLGAVLALGIYAPRPPAQTSDHYVGLPSSEQSVDDERGLFAETSLLHLNKDRPIEELSGWIAAGRKARREHVRVTQNEFIGYFGFFAGPDVHIIDPFALGDPLLARLPFAGGVWAPGHFLRKVPDGYPEAAIDEGQIADPRIAAYWRKLELVTRGPLLDGARLEEVARFNLGFNPPPR
jgi:arabinofuranosyltransferase